MNKLVVLGFGAWAGINFLPTLGFTMPQGVGPCRIVAWDSYAAGSAAGDAFVAGPIRATNYLAGAAASQAIA